LIYLRLGVLAHQFAAPQLAPVMVSSMMSNEVASYGPVDVTRRAEKGFSAEQLSFETG